MFIGVTRLIACVIVRQPATALADSTNVVPVSQRAVSPTPTPCPRWSLSSLLTMNHHKSMRPLFSKSFPRWLVLLTFTVVGIVYFQNVLVQRYRLPDDASHELSFGNNHTPSDAETLTDEEQERYMTHLELLPMTDWETKSAGPERVCEPIDGIPEYCCMGSASSGGQNGYDPELCRNSPDNMFAPYHRVQRRATQWLEEHPLPTHERRRCDTCQLVHTLSRRNLSLAFLGDSLMRQVAAGMECDLRRRNYHVTVQTEARPHNATRWRYHWTLTKHIDIRDGEFETKIRFFGMYRPDKNGVMEILDQYPVDVLVFDHGTHYMVEDEELDEFVEDSIASLGLIFERVPLVVWKETSAQHYENAGGHFSWEVSENRSSCHSWTTSDASKTAFATKKMKEVADALHVKLVDAGDKSFLGSPMDREQRELVMLPFRSFTSPLWNLHPAFPDCTHFCSTPFLWLPLWRTLRLSVDRAVQNRLLSRNERK